MEGLKTLQPPSGNMSKDKRQQKHSKSTNNGPSSAGKLLQLTPLWEQVLRNKTVPPEIDKERLFSELGIRLQDLEWEVRQHALRFLIDLIPVIGTAELDSYMAPVVLPELTSNLGHPAPAVRKGALDTLKVYLSKSSDPERALRVIISEGLEKQTTPNANRGNVAMGVILSIPALLSPLISRQNGIIMMSQEGLIHLMYALSKKLIQITYQEQALRTLIKIRDMVGEGRFNRFLEGFHPQCKRDFDILCHVYDVRSILIDSGIDVQTPPSAEESLIKENAVEVVENGSLFAPGMNRIDQNQNHIKSESHRKSGWHRRREREDERNGRALYLQETRSYIVAHNEIYDMDSSEKRTLRMGDEDARHETPSSYQDTEDSEISAVTVFEEAGDEIINSGRVILETEIKFSGDEAIMMTIMEEGDKPSHPEGAYYHIDGNSPENMDQEDLEEERHIYNNDYIVKVLTEEGEEYGEEGEEEILEDGTRRTPRRVRFGSEMVKMRTPDSDDGSVQQGGPHDDASNVSDSMDDGSYFNEEGKESFSVLGTALSADETQEQDFNSEKSEDNYTQDSAFQLIETEANITSSSETTSIQDQLDSIQESTRGETEPHMESSAFAVIGSQDVESTIETEIVSDETHHNNTFEIEDNESEVYEQESVVSYTEDNQGFGAENEYTESVQDNREYSQDHNAFHIIGSTPQENAFEIAESILDETSEIPENESYILDNAFDFQDNVSEIPDNASDMPDNNSDIPDNASDFVDNASDYPDNTTDYQDNISEIQDSAFDTQENGYYFEEGSISPQDSTNDLASNADFIETNDESQRENNAFQIIDASVEQIPEVAKEDAFQIVNDQNNDEYVEKIELDAYEKDPVCIQDVIYASEDQSQERFVKEEQDSNEVIQRQGDEVIQERFVTTDAEDKRYDLQQEEAINENIEDKFPATEHSEDIKNDSNELNNIEQQNRESPIMDAIQGIPITFHESIPESADNSTQGSIETVIENPDYLAQDLQTSRELPEPEKEKESFSSEPMPPSHIPLPIAPARNKPKDHKRRGGFRRKTRSSGTSTDSPTENSGDNASDTSTVAPARMGIATTYFSMQEETEDSANGKMPSFASVGQNWENFGIVSQTVLDDLHDKDEWLARMRGLENLVAVLRLPDILQRIIPCLPSLLDTLLVTLGDDANYRVAVCALSGVRQLIQALPVPLIMAHLPQLVSGLVRHVGGSGSVNLKIEAVQAAKILMQIVRPSSVVFNLLTSNCIAAKSSKMRENSLLLLTYATLTFPSTEFLWDEMAGRVVNAVADPRRRVRQAALECLAVFAQFTTPKVLDDAVKGTAERQSTHAARDAFLAAVQARLARRALPTVSPDGLILYALQIPASRCNNRGGITLTPSGADVEWVVAGSGSLSSGSAKSRAQLIAAQRLDPQPGAVSTPVTSTAAVVIPEVDGTSKSANLKGNPWTVRRSVVAVDTKVIPPYNRSHSAGQKGSWSLYPIVGGKLPPDEQRPRGGGLPWTADAADSARGAALATSTGSYRPLYFKLQTPPDAASVERGFSVLPSKLAAVSISSGGNQEKLSQTWPPPSTTHHSPRVLTPTQHRGRRILEPLNNSNPGGSDEAFMRRRSPARVGVTSGGRTKIPPLSSPSRYKDRDVDSGQQAPFVDDREDIIDLTKFRSRSRSEGVVERSPSKHGKRRSKNRAVKVLHDPVRVRAQSSPSIHVESVSEDCTILQKPMLARQPMRHEVSSSNHSDSNGRQSNNSLFSPPAEPFLPAVDPSTPQFTRSTPPITDSQQQDELEFKSIDENDISQQSPEPIVQDDPSPIQQIFQSMEAEERAYKYQLLKEQENHTTSVPSSTAAVEDKSTSPTTTEITEINANGVSVPSTPQKVEQNAPEENNNEMKTMPHVMHSTTGSIIDLHLEVEDASINSNTANIKRPKRIKRTAVSTKGPIRAVKPVPVRDGNRNQQPSLFLESLGAVQKPKDAMHQCFAQLDSGEWEVIMQGLQMLVRLLRYHPDTIHHHLHSVMVALGKQVRNLRSQVARAACQACADLFVSQKRAVETDLDEIAAPLLHRTADTNRFLRADSNAALDKMVENISPSRAVSVIVNKGISHQNAVVRTSCARLLVDIVKHLGADKVMSHPSEMRDKILLTGANLLTEGSLETRCLAKELLRLLSKHPSFLRTMNEVIPSQLLRNISKTLQTLK